MTRDRKEPVGEKDKEVIIPVRGVSGTTFQVPMTKYGSWNEEKKPGDNREKGST